MQNIGILLFAIFAFIVVAGLAILGLNGGSVGFP